MEKITIKNIEEEIEHVLESKPMTCDNLERFVLLSRALKYLRRMGEPATEETAEEWMAGLEGGPHWTKEQTTTVMRQRGYDHKPCVFWAVMNSLYSDYGTTMAKYNADRPEVWADLAHDWIDDEDAQKNKFGKYFADIVRHEKLTTI